LEREMQMDQTRQWVVMKFGGTSVSSVDCWETICGQAGKNVEAGKRVMIVVSALSGVTNLLTSLAEGVAQAEKDVILAELTSSHRKLSDALGLEQSARFEKYWNKLLELAAMEGSALVPAQRALLLAHGELLSSSIGHQVLASAGLNPVWQDARDLLEVAPDSGDEVLSARCDDHADPGMEQRLSDAGMVHITQGFIASGPGNTTCLLGRCGSDTSAAYLAARLVAAKLEIWTDVPGIFSADPRVVPEARLLRRLSYSEAQELASMGARVLHPPSIHPARRHGVPIYIKDTNRPAEDGTRIGARAAQGRRSKASSAARKSP